MWHMLSLVCVCVYIFRLAEMESQNCSFFTDSLSPDESLWVCGPLYLPLITTRAFYWDYVCVLCAKLLDTLIVSACAQACAYVCDCKGKIGSHNQGRNENDPQWAACTKSNFIMHILGLKSVALGRYTKPRWRGRGIYVFVGRMLAR